MTVRINDVAGFGRLASGACVGAAWLAAGTTAAHAIPSPVLLSSLASGSAYRLVFTSNGTTTATSTSISAYNTFVSNQAALNTALPTATWTVIGSTATVNAITNVSCGTACNAATPVFTTNGVEVAASTNDIFSGSILSQLNIDQFGNQSSNYYNEYVFTGSNADGTASASQQLGSANPEVGDNYFTNNGYYISAFNYSANSPSAFYGLSSELFVPTTAVPEPMSALLLGVGGIAAGLARRTRRHAMQA